MLAAPAAVGAAFHFARRAVWQHFGLFAAILLTAVAAWVVLEALVIGGQRLGLAWWALAHLAFLTFFAGLEAGLARVCLDLYDGGSPGFAAAFGCLALGPKLLLGQLVYLLVVLVGLVLLIVPGVYLAARWGLFSYQLVAGDADLVGSFRVSAALSRGVLGQLALLLAGLVVLNVLGACVLGVGLFLTLPFSVLMMAAVYRQLAGPIRA